MTIRDNLRRFIEHAPPSLPPSGWGVKGWFIPDCDAGEFVCWECAGRIMARGCSLNIGTDRPKPVWPEDTTPRKCCVCDKEARK